MSDERRDVIGSLPSTRPHRRSDKRAPVPGRQGGAADQAKTPAETTKSRATTKAAGRPASASSSTKRATAKATKKPATAKAGKPTPAASAPLAEPTRATPRRPAAKKPPANVRTRTRPTPPPAPVATPEAEPPAEHHGTLETVVQAAAELTEIGLRASARALRGAVSRLPRP